MTDAALRKLDRERMYNIVVAAGALLGQGYPTREGGACWYCGAGLNHPHGECEWQHLADAYHLRLDTTSALEWLL